MLKSGDPSCKVEIAIVVSGLAAVKAAICSKPLGRLHRTLEKLASMRDPQLSKQQRGAPSCQSLDMRRRLTCLPGRHALASN